MTWSINCLVRLGNFSQGVIIFYYLCLSNTQYMLTTLSYNTATCSVFTHHLQGLSKTDIVDIYCGAFVGKIQ